MDGFFGLFVEPRLSSPKVFCFARSFVRANTRVGVSPGIDTVPPCHSIQCIVTRVQTRKLMGTLSLSLYKAVMYLEYSPFPEKERDGWRLIAPMCPFVSFFILL